MAAWLLATTGLAVTWINPLGGAWNDPTNWSGGTVPNGGEVTIALAGSYTITNLSEVTLSRLVLDNPGAVIAGPGSLRITNLFDWRAGSLGAPATAC